AIIDKSRIIALDTPHNLKEQLESEMIDPEVTEMRKQLAEYHKEITESHKINEELVEMMQLREKFDKLPKPTKKPAKNI
ncbi:MAG: hypothetical protein K8E24_012945, partial [Methanobacterium paludis]|nr:hypothetical protein [Methanobacterium paludis]